MADYINRQEAKEWIAAWLKEDKYWHPYSKGKNIPTTDVFDTLSLIPAADVVSKAAYDQVAWERHLAEVQLKSIGKSIGEKMDDVQPVKHAAWDYAMPVDGPERNRYRCSRCSGFALLDYWGNDVRSRYCPECGAIMDDLGKKYWVHYEGELTPAED